MGNDRRKGLRRWLLLGANRWFLAAVILVIVFLAIVATSTLEVARLRVIVDANGGVQFLFSAFIGAIITGTSIVVTINQLVLSQELGAVGNQRERMDGASTFRRDAEETIGQDVAPIEPGAFLSSLAREAAEGGQALGSAADDVSSPSAREALEAFAADLESNAAAVADGLDGAEFGTFEVIDHALQFDYSRHIHGGRTLRTDHAESVPPDVDQTIGHVLDVLRMYGPAREHFKTLYFQWALINLSRALLYVSIPSLATMGVLALYVDETTVTGTIVGIDQLVLLAAAGFTIGIAPFVIFIVFILRIATVAKQTLAMGPFILRERGE